MKRSDRLVSLMNYLLENPNTHTSLPYFSDAYNAAKSSISEDLDIIDRVLSWEGIGHLESAQGASGGVRYIPGSSQENSIQFIDSLCEMLENPSRILPGGYLYMSDILGDP